MQKTPIIHSSSLTNEFPKNKLNYFLGMILFSFLALLITIYPSNVSWLNTYIPYFLVGAFSLYIIVKKNNTYVPLVFFLFGFWSILISIIFSAINNMGIIYSVQTSIGCLFPICSYIIGKYFSNKIKMGYFDILFFSLLLIQTIVVYLQMSGNPLGIESYRIFAGDKGAVYLQYISFGNRYQALGTIGNPNELSVFSLLLFTFLIFRPNVNKILLGISFLFIVYIIMCSQSRTAVIVFCIVIFSKLMYDKKKSYIKSVFKFLFFSYIVVLIFTYMANNLGRKISFDGLEPRFVLWSNAMENIYSFNDIQNFGVLIFGRGISFIKLNGSTDQMFLNAMLSSGLIGLLIFIYIFLILLKKIIKLPRSSYKSLTLMLLVIFIVIGTVMDAFYIMKISFIFFFLMGYLLHSKVVIHAKD